MAKNRTCKTCSCRCLLITLRCVIDKSILNLDNGSEAIKAEMDAAQRLYLLHIIGEACLDELCAALDASELDPTDENYVPLSPAQEEVLFRLEPVIIAATEYLFFQRYGFSKLTSAGAKYQENWLLSYHEGQLASLEQRLDAEVAAFRTWFKVNCGNLDCYPCDDTPEECKDDLADIDICWTTTSPYNF